MLPIGRIYWLFLAIAFFKHFPEASGSTINLSGRDSGGENFSNKVENLDLSTFRLPCEDRLTILLPGGKSIATSTITDCNTGLISLDAMESQNEFIHVENENGSSLNMYTSNESIFASINNVEDGFVIQIGKNSAGDAFANLIDTENFPPEIDPVEIGEDVHRNLSNVQSPMKQSFLTRRVNDDIVYIDIMVVWTKKAECRNSKLGVFCTVTSTTNNNMDGLVNLAVHETNAAFAASAINTRINLVHSYRDENYENDAFPNSLYDITGGELKDVNSKRIEYGADMVAMIIDDTRFCGLGWKNSVLDPDYMFSVTHVGCATGHFSFGHELAHNMGCAHDRGTSNACASDESNYGYRDPGSKFRTIMAYNCVQNQCDQLQKYGCPRLQRFSNPNLSDITYNNPLGTEKANNAQHINQVSGIIAEFFHQPTDTPSQEPTNVPSPSPSIYPTQEPTATTVPSLDPSSAPSLIPSISPSLEPTTDPTSAPTEIPSTTLGPTVTMEDSPTSNPETVIISPPTTSPTPDPTAVPTPIQTISPTSDPTSSPTLVQTASPTTKPTSVPTSAPTPIPTSLPSMKTAFPSNTIVLETSIPSESLPTSNPSLATIIINPCRDSLLRFNVTLFSGKTKEKTCDWMSSATRCNKVTSRGLGKSICPVSCEVQGCQCADKGGRFTHPYMKNPLWNTRKWCKQLRKNGNLKIANKCRKKYFYRAACPKTCGKCPSD